MLRQTVDVDAVLKKAASEIVVQARICGRKCATSRCGPCRR
jgi:hypothetical protein